MDVSITRTLINLMQKFLLNINVYNQDSLDLVTDHVKSLFRCRGLGRERKIQDLAR